jgi:hypothetical protein
MKIEGPGAGRPATVRRSRAGEGASGKFSDALGGASSESAATGQAHVSAPISSLDALLALQAVPTTDEAERRQEGLRRGEDILDRLEDLKARLLLEEIPASALRELVDSVSTGRQTLSDPKLMSVLDEIDLRARVELAKLGVDPFAP